MGLALTLVVLVMATAATPSAPPPPDKYAKVIRTLAIGKEVLQWIDQAFRTWETAQQVVFGDKAGLELTSSVAEKVDWYLGDDWVGTTKGKTERLTLRLTAGTYILRAECSGITDRRAVMLRSGALQVVEANFKTIAAPVIPSDLPHRTQAYLREYFPGIALDRVKVQSQRYGYEVLFNWQGELMEVEFDFNNSWLETEYESVNANRVPQSVRDKVSMRFPGAPVQEYEIEKTANGTFYEIEVIVNGQEVETYYSTDGKRQWNYNEDFDAPGK